MLVSDFDFELPESSIALRPASPRDSARLLQVTPDVLADYLVSDLPALLRAGDVLVFNDTKVIPAFLEGYKGAARISVNLLERLTADSWRALVRNSRRLNLQDEVIFADNLQAEALEKGEGGEMILRFYSDGPLDVALDAVGKMPLPPYIARRRPVDARDQQDYQTVYAREAGAVAAPTAGLHFTPRLLDALTAAGVAQEFVTLHVGAGTFLPVKAEDTENHHMHSEWGKLTPEVAARLRAAKHEGRRILAVGTTALRVLEASGLAPFEATTDIFITPGYRFQAIDGLFTNFHLPKSTLFMLVSALMGLPGMQAAYAHALQAGYRFYSYGDASLLLPKG